MRYSLYGIALAAIVMLPGVSQAQVGALSDSEAAAPDNGRPSYLKAANLSDPSVPKPSRDPRDLAGQYVMLSDGMGSAQGSKSGIIEGPNNGPRRGNGPAGAPPGPPPGAAPVGKAGFVDTPANRYCIPDFRQLGDIAGGIAIYQTRAEIIITGEEHHPTRHIYLNARHDPAAPPSIYGDSIGHWEGDKLIVETNNFKNGGALVEQFSKNLKDGSITHHVISQTGIKAGPGGPPGGLDQIIYWSPGNYPDEWICEDFTDNFWGGYMGVRDKK